MTDDGHVLETEVDTEDGQVWTVCRYFEDGVARITRLGTFLTRNDLEAMLRALKPQE